MRMFLAPVLAYILPVSYLLYHGLTATSQDSKSKHRLPIWVNAILATMMLGSNIYNNGLMATARSAGAVVILSLFLIATGILSRNGLISLSTALLGLPVMAWVGLLPGVFLATVISVILLTRKAGKGYIKDLATDTAISLNAPAILSGTSLKISLDNLPIPDEKSVQREDEIGQAHRIKINFNLYLGLSLLVMGLFAFLWR